MTEENNFCMKFPSAKGRSTPFDKKQTPTTQPPLNNYRNSIDRNCPRAGTEMVNNQTTFLWDNHYTSRQRDNSGNNDKHTLPMIDMGASSGLVCRQRPKGAYCNSREHHHSQAHQIRNTSHIRTDSGLRDNESIYGSSITVSSASEFNRNKLLVNRCNMTQMAWSTEVYTENHRSHVLRPITESCNSTKQPYSRNKHNIEDRLSTMSLTRKTVNVTTDDGEGLNDYESIDGSNARLHDYESIDGSNARLHDYESIDGSNARLHDYESIDGSNARLHDYESIDGSNARLHDYESIDGSNARLHDYESIDGSNARLHDYESIDGSNARLHDYESIDGSNARLHDYESIDGSNARLHDYESIDGSNARLHDYEAIDGSNARLHDYESIDGSNTGLHDYESKDGSNAGLHDYESNTTIFRASSTNTYYPNRNNISGRTKSIEARGNSNGLNYNSGPSLVSSTQFTSANSSNEGLNDTELISSYVKDMKSSIESMKRGSAEHVTPNKPVSRFIKRTTDSDSVGTGASGINDANYAKEEIGLGNEISIITDRKTYDKIMKKNFTFERMCMSDRNSITLKGLFDFEEDTKFESDFFKIKSEDLKCEFNFPGSDIKFKVPIKRQNLVTDDEMVPLLKTLIAVVTDGDKWIKQTAQYSISYKQDIYCQDVKLLHKGDNLFQPKSNGFVTFSCSKLSSFCIISKPKKIKQIPYPHEGMKVKTGENGYLILEFPSKVENEIEYQVLPPIMGDIQTLDEYWKPKVLKAVSETLSLSYTERDQPPYVSFSESFMACEDPETIPKLIGYKPNGMPFYLPMNLKEGTKTLYKVENSSRVAFASVYKANMNNFSALKQELEVFYGRKVLCTLSLACKQLDGKLVLSTVCASPSDVAKCNANFVHSDSTIVWKSDALYMDPLQRLRISVGGCLTTLPGESKSHFFTFLNTSKQNIHSFPVAFKPGGVGYAIVEFSYDNINQGHPLAVIHFYPHHPFSKITAKIS